VYDKIVIKSREKKIRKSDKFSQNGYPSKRRFRNGIHSLLKQADARGSAVPFTLCDAYSYFAGQTSY